MSPPGGGGRRPAPLSGSHQVLVLPGHRSAGPAQEVPAQHGIRPGPQRLRALDRLGLAAMSGAAKSSSRLGALLN